MKYLPKALGGLLIVSFVCNPLFVVAESENITKQEYSVDSKEEIIQPEHVSDSKADHDDFKKVDSLGNVISEEDIQKAKISVENLRNAYNTINLSNSLDTGGGVTISGPMKPKIDGNTGALEYEYNFVVPSGRQNMSPDVSFTYNSQVSNNQNYIGYGFQTSIPYIQRLNTAGIENLYTTNHFTSNVYDDLIYSTSSDTFYPKVSDGTVKLKRVSNTWEVTYTNGKKYVYGTVGSARVEEIASTTNIHAWYLSDVYDQNSNSIRYTYLKDNNFVYPNTISYTNNSDNPGVYNIIFIWENRPDSFESYKPGFKTKTTKRLKQLELYSNNVLKKKSSFRYASGTNGVRSLLAGITEVTYDSSGVATTFPEITFEYSQPATEDIVIDRSYKIDRAFDVNGDGLLDFVFSRVYYGIDSSNNRLEEKILYINKKTNFETLPLINQATNCTIPWNSTCYLLPETQIPFFLSEYNTGQTNQTQVFPVEVDGDGYVDIAGAYSGFKGMFTKLINNQITQATSSLFFESDTNLALPWSGNYIRGFNQLNINGDKTPDFLMYTDQTNSPFSLNQNNQFVALNSNLASSFFRQRMSQNDPMFPSYIYMDVNGDELTDMINVYSVWYAGMPRTEYKKVWINNGKALVEITDPAVLALYNLPRTLEVQTWFTSGSVNFYEDINFDDLPDTMVANWTRSIGTGNGFVGTYDYGNNSLPVTGSMIAADINGDGLVDLLTPVGGSFPKFAIKMSKMKADMMTAFKNGTGGEVVVVYAPAVSYQKQDTTQANKISYPLWTVKTETIRDGNGNQEIRDYFYEDAHVFRASRQNTKLAGFGKVTITNSDSTKKVFYYHQGNDANVNTGEIVDSYARIGRLFRIDIISAQNNLFKRTWYTWNEHDRGNGAWLVTPQHTLIQNFDGNQAHTDVAVTTTYDTTNGNLLTTTEWGEVLGTDTGTFTDTLDDKQTTTITYATNDTQTQFAPKEVIKTNKNDVVVQRTKFYYDNLPLGLLTKGNNTKQEAFKDPTNFVTTRTVYNAFGLPIETYDGNNKKTEYTYDTYNLYPKTVTNPLGHVTTYTYDYVSGKPSVIVDQNRTTKVTYDGLGRPLSERIVYANGTEKLKTQHQYVDTSSALSVKVSKYMSDGDTQDEYTYFDGLRRPIQTKKEFENGQWATIDTGYGPQGEIAFTSLPYFTSVHTKTSPTTEQPLRTTYTYDPLRRVVQERNALGVTTTEYAGSYRTVTNPLLQRTRYKYDAFGNLTEVMHSLGLTDYTTSYYYNANKNLVKTVDANNNVRNFEYDWLGRQTKAEDVHAPTDATFAVYQYTYDDNGNVITKILPDGRSVTYTYDDLNRLTHEKVSGTMQVDVMNIYDSCTYGVGRICTTSTPEYYKNFTYTQDGFINTETVLHGGTQTTTYTYTPSGDISSIKNPDNSKVVYVRDTAGYIDSVHYVPVVGATSTIVSQIEYAPTGLITSQTNGNGTKTCNVYDRNALYRLTSKKTVGVGGVCGGVTLPESQPLVMTENSSETIDAKIDRLINEKKLIENEQGELRLLVPEVLMESVYDKESLVGFTQDKQPLYQYEVVIGKDIPEGVDQKTAMPDAQNVSQLVATTSLSVSPQATVLATNYAGGNIVPYPNPWDAVRNMATGTNMQPSGGLSYATSEYGRNRTQAVINRMFMNFDTRNIPDNALLQSAYVDLYGLPYSNASSSNDFIGVLQNLQTSSSSISLIDYSKCGTPQSQPVLGGKKLLSEFTTQQYYRIPLFAEAKPWIDTQGMTRLCLREGHDILNQAPPENTWDFARRGIMVYPETSIISQRSKLVVEYTLPVATTTTAQLPTTTVTALSQPRALQNIHTNTYTYDAVGNITSITTLRGTSTPQEAVYTYDALHRLLSRQMGPETESFTYDGIGNILTKNGIPYLYETPQKANPHAVTKIGAITFTYDQQGNALTIGEQVHPTTNVWSYKNELLQTSRGGLTVSYLYDPRGVRVYKEVGGVMTKYPSPYYSHTNTGTSTTFIMTGNENVATITNGGVLWNHTDHLGSTIATTNNTGSVVETTDYSSFGHQTTRSTFSNTEQTEKYTGHTYDPETDLLYAQARYYRGSVGRFLSPDPLHWNLTKEYLADPQQQNSYSYARNNPLKFIDTTGKYIESMVDVASLGLSIRDYQQNPNLANAAFVELDTTALFLPVPALVGYVRHGGELKQVLKNGERVTNTGVEVSKNANNINNTEALKANPRLDQNKEESFFKNTTYSESVIQKNSNDIMHGFPKLIEKFESSGIQRTVIGGDGKQYFELKIPGGINGKTGSFEFIKNTNNQITHRFFRKDK